MTSASTAGLPASSTARAAAPEAVTIALIGYGEVGQLFGAQLAALPGFRVSAHDILMAQPDPGARMAQLAAKAGISTSPRFEDAVAGADVVFSAVTAEAAFTVAQRAGALLRPGQFFVDLNSISPASKQRCADCFAGGAAYIEAAVMAPVAALGLAVPMLLGAGAADAAALQALMAPAGLALTLHSTRIGAASAVKMCRSVIIKGLEALVVESMLCARHYGVEDTVLASLDVTFPAMAWQRQADYMVSRVLRHGRRRAAEMREAALTVRESGLTPLMAAAVAQRQDWLADRVDAGQVRRDEDQWREVADALDRADP
jgi:3-hydroxyisobutyrate dehydrogenase-like beta-hydroxyacid dehydrogenase